MDTGPITSGIDKSNTLKEFALYGLYLGEKRAQQTGGGKRRFLRWLERWVDRDIAENVIGHFIQPYTGGEAATDHHGI